MISFIFQHEHHPLGFVRIHFDRSLEIRVQPHVGTTAKQTAVQAVPNECFLHIHLITFHRHALPTEGYIITERRSAIIPLILLRQRKRIIPKMFPNIRLPENDLGFIRPVIGFLHISHIIQVETGRRPAECFGKSPFGISFTTGFHIAARTVQGAAVRIYSQII